MGIHKTWSQGLRETLASDKRQETIEKECKRFKKEILNSLDGYEEGKGNISKLLKKVNGWYQKEYSYEKDWNGGSRFDNPEPTYQEELRSRKLKTLHEICNVEVDSSFTMTYLDVAEEENVYEFSGDYFDLYWDCHPDVIDQLDLSYVASRYCSDSCDDIPNCEGLSLSSEGMRVVNISLKSEFNSYKPNTGISREPNPIEGFEGYIDIPRGNGKTYKHYKWNTLTKSAIEGVPYLISEGIISKKDEGKNES